MLNLKQDQFFQHTVAIAAATPKGNPMQIAKRAAEIVVGLDQEWQRLTTAAAKPAATSKAKPRSKARGAGTSNGTESD